MSIWSDHDLTDKVLEVLRDHEATGSAHPFGQPFLSAYQLAIELDRRFPETVAAIGKPIGGTGTGQRTSLAQYVAGELAKQIKADRTNHPVEGARLADAHLRSMTYVTGDNDLLHSSLIGAYPLSMFRLRRN